LKTPLQWKPGGNQLPPAFFQNEELSFFSQLTARTMLFVYSRVGHVALEAPRCRAHSCALYRIRGSLPQDCGQGFNIHGMEEILIFTQTGEIEFRASSVAYSREAS
jgi:hypothetical protein